MTEELRRKLESILERLEKERERKGADFEDLETARLRLEYHARTRGIFDT